MKFGKNVRSQDIFAIANSQTYISEFFFYINYFKIKKTIIIQNNTNKYKENLQI